MFILTSNSFCNNLELKTFYFLYSVPRANTLLEWGLLKELVYLAAGTFV